LVNCHAVRRQRSASMNVIGVNQTQITAATR
jgi:hypothetical protein